MALGRLVPEGLFLSLTVRILMIRLVRELTRLRDSCQALPAGVATEVQYEGLVADPLKEVLRIGEFLGTGELAPRSEPAKSSPRPRRLHPAFARHGTAFIAELEGRGLWRAEWTRESDPR